MTYLLQATWAWFIDWIKDRWAELRERNTGTK